MKTLSWILTLLTAATLIYIGSRRGWVGNWDRPILPSTGTNYTEFAFKEVSAKLPDCLKGSPKFGDGPTIITFNYGNRGTITNVVFQTNYTGTISFGGPTFIHSTIFNGI